MLGGRVFGPADWPGHDAQGERIEGEKGVDVKEWGGVMRGLWGANRGLVSINRDLGDRRYASIQQV
jgi:hypothetical protein